MIQPIEIYPMAMFPTLSVADVRASVEPYTERVGFASVFTLPGPDGGVAMAHLTVAEVRGPLLAPDAGMSEDGRAKGVGVVLSFLADSEPVDEVAASLVAKGVAIAEGPSRGRGTCGTSLCMTPTGIGWSSLRPWTFPGALRT